MNLLCVYRPNHLTNIGGVCGRVFNTLNSRSGGLGFKPCPSRCFLRQGTLPHFVSLHPGVYKWVLATYCWGVTLRWTSILSRGEQQYSWVLHANKIGNKPRQFQPLARVRLYLTVSQIVYIACIRKEVYLSPYTDVPPLSSHPQGISKSLLDEGWLLNRVHQKLALYLAEILITLF